MAASTWTNLPSDILSTIAKILNTDVDILRLRSVCSSWRSSIPRRPRPSPFPLIVPPLRDFVSPDLCSGSRFFLNYSTLYRLSPPEHGPHAGDPSDGWLLRVLEVNPNRFSLLNPLAPDRVNVNVTPEIFPKHLNLLDYRVSEICKCYKLDYVGPKGNSFDLLRPAVRKIIVLREYAVDSDFVVLVVFASFVASYWKFGDKDWTPVDTEGYDITDVAVCGGKCYAISNNGLLLSFDSDMRLTVVDMPGLPMDSGKTVSSLVEYKSDLYVVEKIYEEIDAGDVRGYEGINDGEVKKEIPFRCEVFKKCDGWTPIRCLEGDVFLSCVFLSVRLSAEDFRCCKGNSVYVALERFLPDPAGRYFKHFYSGVYSLADGRTSYMKLIKAPTFVYWPPPSWLMSN